MTITVLDYYDLCGSAPADQEIAPPTTTTAATTGTFQIAVDVEPGGAGWVRSDPYLIDCPNKCQATYGAGGVLTLEAHPTSGFTFEGWSGDRTGADACVVTMDHSRNVVAHFGGHYVPPRPATTTTSSTSTTNPTTTDE